MDIWHQASTLAHPFLNTAFAEKVAGDMRNIYLPDSETWIYEEEKSILGFISMIGNEIGGLFVLPKHHSKGIGTQLVDFFGSKHKALEVEVFEKNVIGRAFYKKYGFEFLKEYTHEESGNKVIRLIFKKQG